jgi:phosphoribosylamine---glycine ligase
MLSLIFYEEYHILHEWLSKKIGKFDTLNRALNYYLMNILLLGSGGREHTLSWVIAKSELCKKLYIAPGNAGTGLIGENVLLNPLEFDKIRDFVLTNNIGFVIVGPEDPIVNGISDYFKQQLSLREVPILAPFSQGAQLEGSKEFAKLFMQKYKIPTAAYKSFVASELDKALEYLEHHSLPIVIKADGLAAGKGVTIRDNVLDAKADIEELFIRNKFGTAGQKVVIEQFLDGIELSAFVLTDGKNYMMLPQAKDYKKIGEGDTGPNTGGMGCISPVPFIDNNFKQKIIERIIDPTIQGLQKEGIIYRGFLFFGLINVGGNPYVIEYNVRLGDPETEVIMPRIDEDMVHSMLSAAKGNLVSTHLKIKPDYAATVMVVSKGYPDTYEKGKPITGLDKVDKGHVFHAGTKMSDQQLVTSGGRVLCVTSLDADMKKALENSYQQLEKIQFDNKYFRKDIGYDLFKYL